MAKNLSLFFVICAAVLVSLPWIGEREFYTRGEPREALVPQKMLESSNWVLPRTFDDRVPSKPPLTHWLIGASALLKGQITGNTVVDEWAARFPAAAFSLAFLAILYVFLESRIGADRSLHTILILLTSVEWSRGMVTSRVDTVLSVFLGFGLLALYSFHEKRSISVLCAAILSFTAATLTKGPVALVLPIGIIGLFLLLEKRQLGRAFALTAQIFIPALILASIWYVRAYQVGGDDFLNKFWYENIERFASSTDDRPHDHSVFYLALMLVVGLLPWSVMMLAPAVRFFRPSQRLRRLKQWYLELSSFERYSAIVVLSFFVFFSIPSSKRGVYLLPSFPFAAVLLSQITAGKLSSTFERVSKVSLTIVAAALLLLPVAVVLLPSLIDASSPLLDLCPAAFSEVVIRPVSWVLLAVIFTLLIKVLRSSGRSSDYFLHCGLLSVFMVAFIQGPVMNGFSRTVSEKRLANQLRELDQTVPLFSYQLEYYGTIFYLGRPVSLLGWQDASKGIILVRERDLDAFKRDLGESGFFTVLGRSTGSVLKLGERPLIVDFGRPQDPSEDVS